MTNFNEVMAIDFSNFSAEELKEIASIVSEAKKNLTAISKLSSKEEKAKAKEEKILALKPTLKVGQTVWVKYRDGKIAVSIKELREKTFTIKKNENYPSLTWRSYADITDESTVIMDDAIII
jgi:hypothetical protein